MEPGAADDAGVGPAGESRGGQLHGKRHGDGGGDLQDRHVKSSHVTP